MSKISVSGDQGVGEVSMTEYVFLLFVVQRDVDVYSEMITTIKSSPNAVKS
jgi:hypothetical protein